MKAYFKCMCRSKDKILIKKLLDQGVEVVIIGSDPIKRAEARQYKMKPPFIVGDKGIEKL